MNDDTKLPADFPGRDLLTEDEVARQLRVSVSTLRRLIRAGRFPRPLPGVSGRLWARTDALWYVLSAGLRPRIAEDKSGSIPDQSRSTGDSDA